MAGAQSRAPEGRRPLPRNEY
jgi:hypothetical protein